MPTNIPEAIAYVMERVPYLKKENVAGQGKFQYTFVGDSDFTLAVTPPMVEIGLVLVPAAVAVHHIGQYPTLDGRGMNHVILGIEYHLLYRGERQVITTVGEGADMGDKACSKAMTAAHKYAIRQAFNIATGDDDPDSVHSELIAKADPRIEKMVAGITAAGTLPAMNEVRRSYMEAKFPADVFKTLEDAWWDKWQRMGGKVPEKYRQNVKVVEPTTPAGE